MAIGKVKKTILILVALAAAVVAIGIIVLLSSLNSIVKTGVEEVLSYVLEVDVTLDSADVKVTEGSVELSGLHIGKPEGFKTDESFSVETIKVKVDIKSFTGDSPTVDLIEIIGPRITLEQGLRKSNFSEMIKSASRFSSDTPEAEDEEPEAAGKPVIIKKILVTEAKVSISAPLLQGKKATIPLPKVEIDDLGSESDPIAPAEAIGEFFKRLFSEALKAGKGIIPDDLGELLGDSLEGAKAAAAKVGEELGDAKEALGDQLKGAKESLGEATEKAKEGLKGLLKFGKKDEDE